MYRIINGSSKSFIVSADAVLKGGKKGSSAIEKIIPSSKEVVEVNDKLGKMLSTYPGITVVEKTEEEKGKGNSRR